MLKKIFAVFVGSLAAIWLSAALFIFLGIVTITMLIGSSSAAVEVKDNSILYLDLSGAINDRAQNRSIQQIITGDVSSAQNLDEILQAIDYATSDDRIDGIYINCDGASLGYASREELIEALTRFKKSGKWIYSYADTYQQSDYYVASVANKMYLNPVGNVDVRGIGSSIPFFKNTLDKLGVEMQIVKVGTFKSAVEPYILTEASEPSRLQTKVYLGAIWNNVTATIAENRKVTTADINMWADSLYCVAKGEKLVSAKAVTELKYRREVEDILRKLTKLSKDDDLRLVSTTDYLDSNPKPKIDADSEFRSDSHIAVLYAVGEIVDEGSGIVGNSMVDEIVSLADDEDVKGLVMRVNSPGGSAFASEQIWEAINYFKSKKKPVYVSMGDYAASGGYYISCGADRIFADANTITGSIGIFGMIPNFKGLLNDKIGVNFTTIQTNENATFPSTTEPMTAPQRAAMQRNVEDGYKLFTSRVADGRKLPVDSVLTIAEGRVWDGKTALKLGLVDQIGSLDVAIAAMAKKLKTNKYNYATYPQISKSTLEQIISSAGGLDESINIDGIDTKQAKRCLQLLKQLQTPKGRLQARMEDVVVE